MKRTDRTKVSGRQLALSLSLSYMTKLILHSMQTRSGQPSPVHFLWPVHIPGHLHLHLPLRQPQANEASENNVSVNYKVAKLIRPRVSNKLVLLSWHQLINLPCLSNHCHHSSCKSIIRRTRIITVMQRNTQEASDWATNPLTSNKIN